MSTEEQPSYITTVRRLAGSSRAAWTAAAIVIVVCLLATFTIGRPSSTGGAQAASSKSDVDAGADDGALDEEAIVEGDPNAPAESATEQGGPTAPGTKKNETNVDNGGNSAACAAGRNGGPTDKGVSATQIKLAATVVKSGVGSAFLEDVQVGMEAVMNKVNRAGGICGRQLSLKLVDDGWKASTGQQYIKSFIDEGYFALAVVPSSEGLRQSIDSGDIDRAGIPVVGTDGMLAGQYTNAWTWPVAASTISTMHIMAANAYERGARTFGIVYDSNYRFGVEGEYAFRQALKRLGGDLVASVGVQAGQNSYTNDINNRFNNNCGECDFVALLLEPQTAVTWIKGGGYLGTKGKAIGVGGPQTLFSDRFANDFAQNCPQPCNTTFWVWTGFKPPLPPYDSDPAVQTYLNDMKATNSSADRTNQFVEGGYDGMLLLVDALKKVGPNLTRARLKQVLDSMDFDSGLATVRSFRPGNHFANINMQAYSIVLNGQNFTGWRYERTGWVKDQWVGQDVPE